MLSLSILIVLHEMGHFLPARFFGTRVEKFYLFFDPYFALIKKKIGDTEYGIGWLPLGGYVKISGMIDESFDTAQMAQDPEPWEFRSKPAWQRLIIMLGGVTVNFILGFLLYGMVLFVWGEQYLPAKNAEFGIAVDSLGTELGLQDGDHIRKVGERPFDRFNDRVVVQEIIINNASTISIERDGQPMDLKVETKYTDILSRHENKDKALFFPRVPFVIQEVVKGSPAEAGGLKKGDRVVSVNRLPTMFFHEFVKEVKKRKGEGVSIGVLRNEEYTEFMVTLSPEGTIGAARYGEDHFFELANQQYTLAQALPAGVTKGVNFLGVQLKAFGQMFRGKIKASESLGGFGSIGKMFGSEWDWQRFWTMTAILSLILAFMNLLPIPALDGGHVVFLLYEMVSGRKPSDKFLERATMVGFVLVIGLVLYANGMDIIRAWFS